MKTTAHFIILAAILLVFSPTHAADITAAELHMDILGGGGENQVETILINGVEAGSLPYNPHDPYGTNFFKVWLRDATVELAPEVIDTLGAQNTVRIEMPENISRHVLVQNLQIVATLDSGETLHSTIDPRVRWSAPPENAGLYYDYEIRTPLDEPITLELPLRREDGQLQIAQTEPAVGENRFGHTVSGRVDGSRILAAKMLYPNTSIVADGMPQAGVCAPPEGPNRDAALDLAAAIGHKAGTDALETIPADEASEDRRSIILVGRETDNPLYRRLMWADFLQGTLEVPGEGGYIIRTIHDPWGSGANVIVITGSEPGGIAAGCQAFTEMVKAGENISVAHLDVRQINPEIYDKLPHPSMTPEEAQKKVADAGDDPQKLRACLFPGWDASLLPDYPDLYHDAMMRMVEALEKERAQNPTWYEKFGTHRLDMTGLWKVIYSWNADEELVEFTPEERARVDQMLFYLTQDFLRWKGYLHNFLGDSDRWVRHNHETYPAITLYFIARYFDTYYDMPAVTDQWYDIARACFERQAQSHKPLEDSQGYNWTVPLHVMEWSLNEEDMTWLESGNWEKSWELMMACTSNLGHRTSFGDNTGFTPPMYAELNISGTLSLFRPDGRHQWYLDQLLPFFRETIGGAYYKRSGRFLNMQQDAREPEELWGVQVCRLSPQLFEHYSNNGTSWRDPQVSVTYEESFDKIALRTDYDPDAQYLLLDGWSMGYHGHADGNSIPGFTDNGRLWLRDMNAQREWESANHDVITFTRNGQNALPPSWCAVEIADDLPKTGFVRSVAREYNGLDWGRNIIWDKEKYVFVIDEMGANEPGDYLFTAHWRTLGDAAIEDRTLRVEQNGETFRLSNTDGSRLQLRTDPAPGTLRLYDHAEAPGAILEQYSQAQLQAGQRRCIENVFYCPTDETPAAPALHIAPGVMALGGGTQIIAGVADEGVTIGDLQITAAAFLASPDRLAVADATSIQWRGHELLTAAEPVSMEIAPPDSITATLEPGQTVEFNPPGEDPAIQLTADAPTADYGTWPQLVDVVSATVVAARDDQPSPPEREESINADIETLASVGDTITAAEFADIDGDGTAETITGTEAGEVIVFDTDGTEIARISVDDSVTAVAAGDLTGDGRQELVIGTTPGVLTAAVPGGETLWEYTFQQPDISQAGLYVTDILCANLDGDGAEEVIATSLSGSWSILDAAGEPLRETVYGKSALVTEAADLDDDGVMEYTVGTEWRGMNVYRFGTEWHRRYRPGRGVKSAAFADLNADGMKEALYGSEILRALDECPDEPGGERWDSLMWEYNTGGEVLSLRTADIDGDGTPDILAGSEGFYLHAVDANGEQIWARLCGGPVSSVEVGAWGEDLRIIAGTDTGRVTIFDANGARLAGHTFGSPVVNISARTDGSTAVVTEGGEISLMRVVN